MKRMSVADSAQLSHGGGVTYKYTNRKHAMRRPGMHLPKHVSTNTTIKYNKMLLDKNFTSAELAISKPFSAVPINLVKSSMIGSEEASVRSTCKVLQHNQSSLPLVRSRFRSKTVVPLVHSDRIHKHSSTQRTKESGDKKEKLDSSDEIDNGHFPTLTSHSQPQMRNSLRSTSHEGLLKLTINKQGELGLQRHITSDHLCSHLKEHGLGDPRDLLPVGNNIDPLSYIRRRIRQKHRYPYYEEKLKGCARLDMESANSKAAAFIEQQKDAQTRQMSATWQKRFRRVVGNDLERFSNGDQCSMFEMWDEDRHRYAMNEQFLVRINTWLDQVNNAITEK